MVVDDEPSILFTIRSILDEYEVSEFSDAHEGIKALKNGTNYDLLIVDFRLQAMSGLDVLIEAKKSLSCYRAILLTAYSNKELLEQVLNNNLVFKVLDKPLYPINFSL